MLCRFCCFYRVIFFVGLSHWNLHLYNLLHNHERSVIVNFSAELFPTLHGNSRFSLPGSLNKQNNCRTVPSFPRFGGHARVTFALAARFVATILYQQIISKDGFRKTKAPKTFIWASPSACESQSHVLQVMFQHCRHFDWCLVASLVEASNITF